MCIPSRRVQQESWSNTHPCSNWNFFQLFLFEFRVQNTFVRSLFRSTTFCHFTVRCTSCPSPPPPHTPAGDTVVPWLKSVIVAPVVPRPDRMLRAKALECLTRIALAVGCAASLPFTPVTIPPSLSVCPGLG